MKHKETGGRKKTPLSKELLHKLYWVKGLSTHEIAKKTDRKRWEIYSLMKKEGVPIRGKKEAQRLRSRRELERVRQHIRPNIPELLKNLDVERTKDGRIRLQSLPPEVRERFKDEALRLREIGAGPVIVARALDIPQRTTNAWSHPPSKDEREGVRRWHREHREELNERAQRERREAREDLIKELGGKCQIDGVSDKRLLEFHELEKEPEDKGKAFLDTKPGRRWRRFRKTKHREEVLAEIREKVMLLGTGCHRKIDAREKRLGRHLTREEILLS